MEYNKQNTSRRSGNSKVENAFICPTCGKESSKNTNHSFWLTACSNCGAVNKKEDLIAHLEKLKYAKQIAKEMNDE